MTSQHSQTHAIHPTTWFRLAVCGVLVLCSTALAQKNTRPGEGIKVNDISGLNETCVRQVVDVSPNLETAAHQIQEVLKNARKSGCRVSIAGSRHTMGGHTISADGIVLNMLPLNFISVNEKNATMTVGAGATWSAILPRLDEKGYSVAVMQSNNSFSVGGSISANCHGWQHNRPPIASTVDSFHLITAEGNLVTCRRTENHELFSAVLGGYGLMGVILDVTLRIVPNDRYRSQAYLQPADKYLDAFRKHVDGQNEVGMAYGRLSIVPGDDFLKESILTVFRVVKGNGRADSDLNNIEHPLLRRMIFRAEIASDSGKTVRWMLERNSSLKPNNKTYSRNLLLNEGVELYGESLADRTDILHEYFVPVAQLEAFLQKARVIIPRHKGDLLNVTIRNVLADNDAMLHYADQNVFGLVMLFNHERTQKADSQMEGMTRELIDAAIATGGRFYLPYRLHATKEQFQKAYPNAAKFFELKRALDPSEIFSNAFYLKYAKEGSPLRPVERVN